MKRIREYVCRQIDRQIPTYLYDSIPYMRILNSISIFIPQHERIDFASDMKYYIYIPIVCLRTSQLYQLLQQCDFGMHIVIRQYTVQVYNSRAYYVQVGLSVRLCLPFRYGCRSRRHVQVIWLGFTKLEIVLLVYLSRYVYLQVLHNTYYIRSQVTRKMRIE